MSDALVPKGQPVHGDPEKTGWLFKWTNYLKGYQRRWFVLSNGLLSYYRNQAEMAHTCRGTISLLGALIHTADSCTFVISNGGTQTFHIRAHDEVERQSWVTALELAKAKAMAQESDDDDDDNIADDGNGGADGDGEEANGIARELAARFHDLRTCSELVSRHGAALQRSLAELESPPSDAAKQVAERATLFRISCNAMMNACNEFMSAASAGSGRLSRALQHEREQKMRLQEIVEQLARQHDNLEKTVTAHRDSTSGGAGSRSETEDDEHEFFDAMEGETSTKATDKTIVMKVPVINRSNAKPGDNSSDSEGETVRETQKVIFLAENMVSPAATTLADTPDAAQPAKETGNKTADEPKVYPHVSEIESMIGGKPRRTVIPEKPNYPLNLWSIMKNCIGKELSKIPIPVNFSEPLSMLQRLVEDYEYSNILDKAAGCSDIAKQLAYVAAFTISSYATTAIRTSKPFNPLLGETYECDRMQDLGWRAVCEQVSHHPPMVAQYCEGASGWECWQEFTMTSKFRGKYLQVIPLGSASAYFTKTENKYTWRKTGHHPPLSVIYVEGASGWSSQYEFSLTTYNRGQTIAIYPEALVTVDFKSGNNYRYGKVTTTVHNIIVGKLWVDNHGDMDIVGEGGAAGYVAHIKYLPYSYFSKDQQRKVTGVINDPQGVPRYVLQGYWDRHVEIAAVTSTNADNSVCKTGKFVSAWQRVPAPPDSDRRYNFSVLAAQLNEPEEGVAPTDSRLRPDQRLMEQGLWNEANVEKVRLEDKQRTKRRQLEEAREKALATGTPPPPAPAPLWFARSAAAEQRLSHLYTRQYWEHKQNKDWTNCPDIF